MTWGADPKEARHGAAADAHALVVCACCGRVRVGASWLAMDEAIGRLRPFERSKPPLLTQGLRPFERSKPPLLTQGLCERCSRRLTAPLRRPSRPRAMRPSGVTGPRFERTAQETRRRRLYNRCLASWAANELAVRASTATFLEFYCACGRGDCDETLTLTLEEYRYAVAAPRRAIVAPGHQTAIHRVVETAGEHTIVELPRP